MNPAHKEFSAHCFNECWTYIDKRDRSPDDDLTMLALAYASYFHWTKRDDVQPMHLSIAYWLLGRVHSLVGEHDRAVSLGHRIVSLSQEQDLGPFSLGYGYEVLVRAHIGLGQTSAAQGYLQEGKQACQAVTETKDQQLLAKDLAKLESLLVT